MICERCKQDIPTGTRVHLLKGEIAVCASCLTSADVPEVSTAMPSLGRLMEQMIIDKTLQSLCPGAIKRLALESQWTDEQTAMFMLEIMEAIPVAIAKVRGPEHNATCSEVRDLAVLLAAYTVS